MTADEIDAFLAPFDVWDRYDHDADGDFDEPDGYIDHFQSVHAGEGEETGGGALGEDAIWSHRSYANAGFPAPLGPEVDGEVVPFGGLPLGESSFWIGDYTIEPENGGVGVFGHEFGHDLDLPDLYDTSGNTGGAENSTAWWTMWSQGSYGTDLGRPRQLPGPHDRLGEVLPRLAQLRGRVHRSEECAQARARSARTRSRRRACSWSCRPRRSRRSSGIRSRATGSTTPGPGTTSTTR